MSDAITACTLWIHHEVVLRHQPSATDLLFITLRKSEALFSPSTRYHDLALRPLPVPLGEPEQSRQGTVTVPFVCLGFARYESHEGERPMAGASRWWRLEREIPAAWLPGCSSPSLALAV